MKHLKLQLHASLRRAHSVLGHIRIEAASGNGVRVGGAQGYENGREHGLSVKVWGAHVAAKQDVTICWAEYRSSDQIVVYVSRPGEDFGEDARVPTERAYEDAHMFATTALAAEYISDVINGMMTEADSLPEKGVQA